MEQRAFTNRRSFLRGAVAAALAALGGGRPARAANEPGPETITAVTWIRGVEGHEAELQSHLLSLAAPTRAEPGCLQYDLRSPERPSQFLRLEAWRSLADLEAHKATPHIRASFEKRRAEGWSTEITVWKRVPG
jgi:quinol monooxygenase YgiN